MEQNVRQIVCEVIPVAEGAALPAPAVRDSRRIRIAVGVLVLAAGMAYGIRSGHYKDHFMAHTMINGIDVSGLTVQEAEERMREQVEDYTLHVTFPDGSIEDLQGADFGLTYRTDAQIGELAGAQNRLAWGLAALGQSRSLTVAPDYSYDPEKLQQELLALPAFREESITEPQNACMVYAKDTNVFECIPEVEGNRLDEAVVMEKLTGAVDDYSEALIFTETDYMRPEIYADDPAFRDRIADLNDYLSSAITVALHDGTEYVIAGETLFGWLAADKEHADWYCVDEEALRAGAAEAAAAIAKKDDKVSDSVTFVSTKSGTVEVPYKTNGWKVDQEAEAEQIYQALLARGENSHKPVYSREDGVVIGDTYVEVDIRRQEVFVYVDGEIVVDVPCVSGTDTVPGRRSDRGLFYIYQKLRNHTMLGPVKNGKPSYASPTSFATYYNRGEAFHDASWRSSFGGNTYVYSGSHGCINMSYHSAKLIYENTEIGMPVLVFGSTKH